MDYESVGEKLYHLHNQGLTEISKSDFAKSLAILLQKYPELGQLFEAWPGLTEAVKQKIMELIGGKGMKL